MRVSGPYLAGCAGSACIVYGAYLVSPIVAWIVAGLMLCAEASAENARAKAEAEEG